MRKIYKKYADLIIWGIFASLFVVVMCCAVSRVFSMVKINTNVSSNHVEKGKATSKGSL